MVYFLQTKNTRTDISINENAKEDFKELMGWTEEEFQKNTVKFG